MNWMSILIALLVGSVLGLTAAFVLKLVKTNTTKELADQLFHETEAQRKAMADGILENLKVSFGSLSLNSLSRATEEFLKLANEKLASEREVSVKELEAKKGLIDQQLQRITAELENASKLMQELERDRVEKFGELASQLKSTGEQTQALARTTSALREALASSKVRGQWGERMAEDVLRIAGFVENVNYQKQQTIEGAGTRPDFTFLLPRNLKLNMDVKFPLDNYIKLLQATSEVEQGQHRSAFLRDVRAKIREVSSRTYINPDQSTVDYVLLFIPNEQVYAFIHEQDSTVLDDAIKNKVVLCSPVTLFAVLAVIRQAVDNFALEQTSNQILSLLGNFKQQWAEFVKKLEQLGKRLDDAQREYETLTTTRRRQLERPLEKIEDLRSQRGLPVSPDETSSITADDAGLLPVEERRARGLQNR